MKQTNLRFTTEEKELLYNKLVEMDVYPDYTHEDCTDYVLGVECPMDGSMKEWRFSRNADGSVDVQTYRIERLEDDCFMSFGELESNTESEVWNND